MTETYKCPSFHRYFIYFAEHSLNTTDVNIIIDYLLHIKVCYTVLLIHKRKYEINKANHKIVTHSFLGVRK
jgi:hypothetical protein